MLKPDTLALTVVLALLTALGPLSTDMYLPSLPGSGAGSPARARPGPSSPCRPFCLGSPSANSPMGRSRTRLGRRQVLLFGLGPVSAGDARLRARDRHRGADRRPLRAGARGFGADRARSRHGARPLRRARAGRELSRWADHGTGAGHRARLRRRSARGLRLALDLHGLASVCSALAACRRDGLPETHPRTRPPSRCPSRRSCAASATPAAPDLPGRTSACSALAYGGLFAFISGSSFVLRRRLWPLRSRPMRFPSASW